MPVLNSDHLLEQAARLIEPPAAGPPRQVDLRRAISAAYYALFHAVMTAAADEYVGFVHRNTLRYALVYRAVDHGSVRDLAKEIIKSNLGTKYRKYFPTGPGQELAAFANAFLELQEKRHAADYDPVGRRKTLDAQLAIATARDAIRRLHAADTEMRRMFISLLLFSPR